MHFGHFNKFFQSRSNIKIPCIINKTHSLPQKFGCVSSIKTKTIWVWVVWPCSKKCLNMNMLILQFSTVVEHTNLLQSSPSTCSVVFFKHDPSGKRCIGGERHVTGYWVYYCTCHWKLKQTTLFKDALSMSWGSEAHAGKNVIYMHGWIVIRN